MPCVGKMFGAPQVLPKAARTVNITEMSVKTNGPLKQTRQPSLWNRIRKKQKALFLPWMMLIQKLKNSFNLNPLDFDSFDLTEEYEMAQLPLNRVPLMSLDEKRKLEKLLHLALFFSKNALFTVEVESAVASFKHSVGFGCQIGTPRVMT